MTRLFTIAAVTIYAAITIQAQKIDTRLTSLLPSKNEAISAKGSLQPHAIDTASVKKQINVEFNTDCTVKTFSAIAMLREGAECPAAQLQALGVEIVMQIGRMLILNVPAESLLALDGIDEIESVNADKMNHLMNYSGRTKSHVEEVATLEAAQSHNLPQAYTGNGVIVGIVDTGIDFNHAAFRKADGTTRVKFAQAYSGKKILKTTTDAAEIATLTTDNTKMSHGTHVGGTAAGSIVEGINNQGMAPEADLALCGMGGEETSDSQLLIAMVNIFQFADSQGKPCVINCSMGDLIGFHDAKSSVVLNGLREYYSTDSKKKGRIIVLSAGNSSGHQAAILTTTQAAGTDGYCLRTVLGESGQGKYNEQTVYVYNKVNNMFYNTDGSEIDADVKVVDVNTGQLYTLEQKPLYNGDDESKKITSFPKQKGTQNGKQYIQFRLADTYLFHEPNLKLAYFVKDAQGKTLRAIEDRQAGTAGFFSCGLAGYADGQDNGAFSIHVCGEEVISVGAYVSCYDWYTIENQRLYYPGQEENDKIASFSSWGTDDYGSRNCPDVIAPGAEVYSAYNYYDASYFTESGEIKAKPDDPADPNIPIMYITNKVTMPSTEFKHAQYYGIMQGTSMSAPNTTGVIALWLQANPKLTYADVRSLIKETSYNDDYTTNVEKIPSKNTIQAGAGKINALGGLQKITGMTAIETVGADGQRQATPATMYGVGDDDCYNLLGQRVSKNAKGIVIYKGKAYLNR